MQPGLLALGFPAFGEYAFDLMLPLLNFDITRRRRLGSELVLNSG